jgi:hypothetical protein
MMGNRSEEPPRTARRLKEDPVDCFSERTSRSG